MRLKFYYFSTLISSNTFINLNNPRLHQMKMKTSIYALLVGIVVLFALPNNRVYGQLLQEFRAKDTVGLLSKKAVTTFVFEQLPKNFSKPSITSVATLSGNFPNPTNTSQTISVGMNMANGKSEIWVYVCKAFDTDAQKDTTKFVIVGNTLLGLTDIGSLIGGNLPISVSDLPFIPDSTLPANWMNSDVLVNRLKTNDAYKAFAAANPDSIPQFVALFNDNTPLPPLLSNEPSQKNTVWYLQFTGAKQTAMTCKVNAINGEVNCFSFSPNSVEETDSQVRVMLYPNPTFGQVIVQLPETFQHAKMFTVYSLDGKVVATVSSDSYGQFHNERILQLQSIQSGTYLLRSVEYPEIPAFKFTVQR